MHLTPRELDKRATVPLGHGAGSDEIGSPVLRAWSGAR